MSRIMYAFAYIVLHMVIWTENYKFNYKKNYFSQKIATCCANSNTLWNFEITFFLTLIQIEKIEIINITRRWKWKQKTEAYISSFHPIHPPHIIIAVVYIFICLYFSCPSYCGYRFKYLRKKMTFFYFNVLE